MKHRLGYVGLVGLVVVALLVGGLGGIWLDRHPLPVMAASGTGQATQDAPNFGLIQQAWQLIQQHYVDRQAIQQTPLTYGAISGMVNALGDTGHSTFLTPEMVKAERSFTQGSFEGIGVEIQAKNGQVVVVAPIANSPAAKAGLRPGDVILKVDGKVMSGLPLDQVVSAVLGPAGTQVTLTIQDPRTQQTRDITLTRAKIIVQNVTWNMLPGTKVAQIHIAGFSQGVSQDLQKTIADATSKGATGIILDLRDDPGGLLDEAISVASQFLKGGNVLLVKDAQGNVKPIPVKTDVPKTSLHMVVLVNAGTASAAEIVAGALQDQRRAPLVGETTFGTGTVLNEFGLPDGSALMLATEEWLTPNGRTIWHHGITPDVVVSLANNAAPLLPEEEQGMTAEQLQASGDAQLLRALALLNTNSQPL